MLLVNPLHTNLDEIILTAGGEPPGVSNVMKMQKKNLSELEGDNWAKNACGNITSQALGACLAESQFEECAA